MLYVIIFALLDVRGVKEARYWIFNEFGEMLSGREYGGDASRRVGCYAWSGREASLLHAARGFLPATCASIFPRLLDFTAAPLVRTRNSEYSYP